MEWLTTRDEAGNLWTTSEPEVRAAVRRALRKWPRHLQSEDSVGEVFCRVAESLMKALMKTGLGRVSSDPTQGRFWLKTVAERAAIAYAKECVADDARKVPLPDSGEFVDTDDVPSLEDEHVEACRAAERKRTWYAIRIIIIRDLTVKQRACLLVSLNPGGIAAVARRFGISPNHVSVCANQTRSKVRRLAASLLRSAA